MTATKPSRSDEIVDYDEQGRITNQIRSQFVDLEPKRPIKPNRSEPESLNPVDSTFSVQNIPELDKFQALRSRSHGVISSANLVDAQEEFVETQYYKELAAIDKQHHTTGSGFIKVMRDGGDNGGYEIQLPATTSYVVNGGENKFRDYKSNPAMNDWVPNLDTEEFVSSKPNRSESN